MTPEQREIWTIKEACDYLRCHPSTMYRFLKRGRVGGAFKVGADWRLRRAEFQAWVASLGQTIERAQAGLEERDVKVI